LDPSGDLEKLLSKIESPITSEILSMYKQIIPLGESAAIFSTDCPEDNLNEQLDSYSSYIILFLKQ
jgi:hypothetical protein